MWVISKSGFISIVQHRDIEGHMLVRARVREDLETAFPNHKIDDDRSADYRFRCVISREDLGQYLLDELTATTYTSHAKEEMSKGKEAYRYSAYMGVWNALMQLQPGGIGTRHRGLVWTSGGKGKGKGKGVYGYDPFDDGWDDYFDVRYGEAEPLPIYVPNEEGWTSTVVARGTAVANPVDGMVSLTTMAGRDGLAYAEDIEDMVDCDECGDFLVIVDDEWTHLLSTGCDHDPDPIINKTQTIRLTITDLEGAN